MAQRCAVCAHPRRAELEDLLRMPHKLARLAREYGLNRFALMRHREVHLPQYGQSAIEELKSAGDDVPVRVNIHQDPQTAFLTSFAANGDTQAALKAGNVTRAQLRKWQEVDEAFGLRFHTAEIEAIEALEAEARTRAVAGSKLVRRVYRHGLLYEEIHEWRPSDAMLTKLLQAAKPEKYGDKLTVTQTTVVKAIDADAWNSV